MFKVNYGFWLITSTLRTWKVVARTMSVQISKAGRESEGEESGSMGVDSAEKWMEAQRNVRYVMDVFD